MLRGRIISKGSFVFVAGCVLVAPWLALAQTPDSVETATPKAQTVLGTAASGQDTSVTIPLIVAKDTPLRVALEEKVRVRHVGQPLKGRVVEDVYRFDRLVIPKGSEVLGHISQIERPSARRRVLAYLNADFSPPSKVEVQFDFLVLPDGREMPIDTAVSPGIPDAVRFMSPSRKKSRAREAIEQAKAEGKRRIHEAIDEVRAPGKKERVKGYLLAQLPYRPQSLRKGTLYQAALAEPLDFGTESVKPDSIAPRGTLPPPEHEVKARLLTPLDSATTEKNAPVEAMITQPVYSAEHKLILPEGSRILGRVTRAQPARRLHRNGQLNVVLTDIAPEMPVELANLISSAPERVEASLDSIEASRSANLALDSEGGTQVKDSKTRYLETGIAVGLAVVATNREGDHDRDAAASDSNDATRGAIGGGLGLRLVGIVTGYAARSHAFTTAMSIYGAGTSVYQHFLSRGREVVFRKDMPMEVSLAGRAPEKPEQEKAAPAPEPKE